MPTPIFAFRLPVNQATKLREVARIYGSRNPSEFCREMFGAILGGNQETVGAFLRKLQQSLAEQLMEEMRAAAVAQKSPRTQDKRPRRVSRGAKR